MTEPKRLKTTASYVIQSANRFSTQSGKNLKLFPIGVESLHGLQERKPARFWQELIDAVWHDNFEASNCHGKAILTSTRADADAINSIILGKIPGVEDCALSHSQAVDCEHSKYCSSSTTPSHPAHKQL